MKLYSAWKLASDWWWVDKFYACSPYSNAKNSYETATVTRSGRFVSMRFVVVGSNGKLHTERRSVHPEARFELVSKPKEQHED